MSGPLSSLARAWRIGIGACDPASDDSQPGEPAATRRDAALPWRHVLGMRVHHVEAAQAAELIVRWAQASCTGGGAGRYVCAANVHMTMEAWDDPAFQQVVADADLALCDGAPMVWALRALGLPQRRRVRVSPDLLIELFAACEARGLSIALYGGDPDTLATFTRFLHETYPELAVACAIAPPFRPPTAEEDARFTRQLRDSGAQLILAGIGCPKQERWMAAHAAALPAVLFGVGAAFDLFGGRTRNAPAWTQDIGLEWANRLLLEPRRLWKRHARNNPRFLALFATQLLARRIAAARRPFRSTAADGRAAGDRASTA